MRRASAFTLVELLTVIIIIAMLAALGTSNYIAARERAQTSGVRENMHTAQTAAEGYHTDATVYADTPDKMDPYFPSGSFSMNGTAGNRGNNPFSGVFNQPLYSETFSDIQAINAGRLARPSAGPGVPGQTGYNITSDGQSFAICGLDGNGIRVPNSVGGTLILSNQ